METLEVKNRITKNSMGRFESWRGTHIKKTDKLEDRSEGKPPSEAHVCVRAHIHIHTHTQTEQGQEGGE